MEECMSDNSSLESTTCVGQYLELFYFDEIIFITYTYCTRHFNSTTELLYWNTSSKLRY